MQIQVKTLSQCSRQTLEWGRCDLSDFDHTMVACLSFSEIADQPPVSRYVVMRGE